MKNKKGFTLIELMIVFAIIGIVIVFILLPLILEKSDQLEIQEQETQEIVVDENINPIKSQKQDEGGLNKL